MKYDQPLKLQGKHVYTENGKEYYPGIVKECIIRDNGTVTNVVIDYEDSYSAGTISAGSKNDFNYVGTWKTGWTRGDIHMRHYMNNGRHVFVGKWTDGMREGMWIFEMEVA